MKFRIGGYIIKSNIRTARIILYGILAVFIIWAAILVAPFCSTRQELFSSGVDALREPFTVKWCARSPKAILWALLLYGLAIAAIETNRKKYRRGREHGSAEWGDSIKVRKKLSSGDPMKDRILTESISLGYDGHKHGRNLNTMVIGGSGAGKTRFYAKPNVLNGASSLVILDPKGEIVRDTGGFLESQGYKVKVLDLVNMDRSHCYNPFVYLKNDDDVQKLVTNIMKSTAPKEASTADPFWDQSAETLLMALILYLLSEAPPEEQNFAMVMELIRFADVKEEEEDYKSPLDRLFDELEEKNPEHAAVKAYRTYHRGSGKTLKSVQMTLVARLRKFDIEALSALTMTDELDLPSIGTEKTALFAVIPDSDTSFNFLVSILYMQLFQQLYYQADFVYGGRLPVHVHFLMDEFANVALPADFDKLLATMRSREISVSIIIQNIAQLKVLYKDGAWENIRGNCDTLLYLGGNELSTHEMISKMLGKETIDTNTYGHSKGRSGSYSKNDQNSGRELMTMDEVALLDNHYAILFVRGFRPILDRKYPLLKHPNVHLSADGTGAPFLHGRCGVGERIDVSNGVMDKDQGRREDRNLHVWSDQEIERMYEL